LTGQASNEKRRFGIAIILSKVIDPVNDHANNLMVGTNAARVEKKRVWV
jgi:hypothetical protein